MKMPVRGDVRLGRLLFSLRMPKIRFGWHRPTLFANSIAFIDECGTSFVASAGAIRDKPTV